VSVKLYDVIFTVSDMFYV